jgi:dTMP kinase
MKIYIGGSVSLSKDSLPRLKRIEAQLKGMGYKVVGGALKKGVKSRDKKAAANLYKRELDLIAASDLMIAEVTVPSWGTAFLMEDALEHGKPVLALFYKDNGKDLPLMIKGHPELYVEHYDEDNLHAVLGKNLKHFKEMKNKKGKLIVIDGADGSGKATQTKLLLKYLKDNKVSNRYITFPRYYTSFHGKHVGRFLTGEFGGNNEVNPYLSSLAFALDRLTARDEIVEWLSEGNVVVADRYVSASLAHQGSKMTLKKRKHFLDWLYEMEYKEHKLPKEDIVIYLYVPVKTAQALIDKKGKRGYTKDKKDEAEKDLKHQKKSIEMYKKLSKRFKHWQMIKCVDAKGNLLEIKDVHELILKVLKSQKII